MDIFQYLFQEASSFKDRMGADNHILWLHIIGGFLIGITFSILGIICLFPKYKNKYNTKKSVILTHLFGYFLLSCGLSRIMDTIGIWHNYVVITGIIKLMTGFLALGSILYMPKVIKEALDQGMITKEDLETVSAKMDNIKQISDNLENNKH